MRAFNNAAVAALEAVMPADRVHKVGEVPPEPVTGYAVVSVGSPGYSNVRNDASAGGKGYRITVMCVGRNADEVSWVADKAEQAFVNGRLTVAGYAVTPVAADEVVSGPIIRDPDGGGFLTCTLLYPVNAYPI